MKRFIPTTKDAIALTSVTVITLGLFVAGLFKVLDYLIVKGLLIAGFGTLFIVAIIYAVKNETKKNRLGDKPQDDLH